MHYSNTHPCLPTMIFTPFIEWFHRGPFSLQRLGNELIERQANPNLRSRLVNALQSLTSANQLSFSLDRINYQRFRKNLNNFLVEVRGFLKTVWIIMWLILYKASKEELTSLLEPAAGEEIEASKIFWHYRKRSNAMLGLLGLTNH
jgi:hypothetical protein